MGGQSFHLLWDRGRVPVEYREYGSGRPVVFVHGVGVNGLLWRNVAPRVAEAGYRCITPDWPLGAHSVPLDPSADLSLPGLADIVADFLESHGLEDVVLVANDTGGAVAQWLVGHRAERVGALVLTSCDAFERFPPRPQLYLKPAARVPGALWLVAQAVRFRWAQRTPFAYGWTTRSPMPPDVMRAFTTPVREVRGVRHDLARLLRAVDTRYTFEAAEALGRSTSWRWCCGPRRTSCSRASTASGWPSCCRRAASS